MVRRADLIVVSSDAYVGACLKGFCMVELRWMMAKEDGQSLLVKLIHVTRQLDRSHIR